MENITKNYPDSNLRLCFFADVFYPSSLSFLLMSENKYSPKLDLDASYYILPSWYFYFPLSYLSIQSLWIEALFCFSFTCQRFLGIVQCLVFLGFLPLLENFGLAAPIPVGIRVLGVETPL